MSDKKYSVFISSTFDDLKDERAAVLRAVLEHGHFPLGMELWGAANDQQWQIIERQIDAADYYVVIIAHRYGTMKRGVSYTQKEYNYAIEKGVPVLGFIQKGGKWNPDFVDKGPSVKKLSAFKTKVRQRSVSFWTNADDLRAEVVLALSKEIQATPRAGWVRASEAVSSVAINEMARLSDENAKLRAEMLKLSENKLPDLGFDVVEATLEYLQENLDGQEQSRFDGRMMVQATLRGGVSVGFSPGACHLEIEGLSADPMLINLHFASGTGASMANLTISGPMEFRIIGKTPIVPWTVSALNSSITLNVRLKPIGYEANYSFTVPMKLTLEKDDRVRWVKGR